MGAKPIVLNGKTYRSIEQMPPDVREKYELAMCLMGDPDEERTLAAFESANVLANGNRNGAADILENITVDHAARNGMKIIVEGMINTTNQTANISTSFGAQARSRSASIEDTPSAHAWEGKPLSSDSAIAPDISNGWSLALAGLLILLLCVAGAAGVWYFFLR